MEEGQERESSPDEQTQISDDDENDGSPTDTPDLWMTVRNEKDTMFEKSLSDDIPTKKHPQTVVGQGIVQYWKNLFKELVKRHGHTDFVSHRQVTCEIQCVIRLGKRIQLLFQMTISGKETRSGWKVPIPKDMKTRI